MGVSNAVRVYAAWGRLDDRPFRLLVYMSIVAKDDDSEPWFALGHETLAREALGLDVPEAEDDPAGRDAALRKVRRAITKLHACGAIFTKKRATFGHRGVTPAKYLLYLDGPRDAAPVILHPSAPRTAAAAALAGDQAAAPARGAELARRQLRRRQA